MLLLLGLFNRQSSFHNFLGYLYFVVLQIAHRVPWPILEGSLASLFILDYKL